MELKRKSLFIILSLLGAISLAAEESAASTAAETALSNAASTAASTPGSGQAASKLFSFGVSLGVDTLPVGTEGETATYQKISFTPDVALGTFGVGLDLELRFRIDLAGETPFDVYLPDWIPNYEGNGRTIWDIYLPKIPSLRYGHPGENLYAKIGAIDDLILGNGFILGNYSNKVFQPDLKISGLNFRVDGNLVKFPYLGIEGAVGNLARLDVLGARLYTRPLSALPLPIIKNVELGASFVTDRAPHLYDASATDVSADAFYIYGADMKLPIIGGALFPLSLGADFAVEPGNRYGAGVSANGRILGIVLYSAGINYLEDGFVANYFDSSYDLYRAQKIAALSEASDGTYSAYWTAGAGVSLFKDNVWLKANVGGPFTAKPAVSSDNMSLYPSLKATLGTSEGFIKGFSVEGTYEKYYLGRDVNLWSDMIQLQNALIGATVSYKAGVAVLALHYQIAYQPDTNTFDATSSITTTIKF
jgi:hypothetical protein